MGKYRSQTSIYYRLWSTLELLYHSSIERTSGHAKGLNAYAFHALPAFVLTVATWESYINHVFLSLFTKEIFGTEIYAKANAVKGDVDKLSVESKTLLLPLLLFGKTFDKGAMPYQDFYTLVVIRNHVTHNFVHKSPDAAVEVLQNKGLLMEPIGNIDKQILTWSEHVQTLEVIRWCMNTLAAMSEALVRLYDCKHYSWTSQFPSISEKDVADLFNKFGVTSHM